MAMLLHYGVFLTVSDRSATDQTNRKEVYAYNNEDRRRTVSSTTATRSEIASAQSLPLSGLVTYQEGSVVSRVILKREKGNVTIFAFDEGQGLSEHTSPFDALVQAVEGEGEVTVAGKTIAVKAGEVVLLPATQPHAVKADTRFKMLLTMIRS
jgi:quercetin dioxygenase-like cupin family protein